MLGYRRSYPFPLSWHQLDSRTIFFPSNLYDTCVLHKHAIEHVHQINYSCAYSLEKSPLF